MEDTFVRLVRQKQARLGLTQSKFAEKLGIDQSTLSYFYGGRRSSKVAAAVAVVFPDLKDAALIFLLEDMPERLAVEQSAESP